ncbi:MAG: MBL fold metallo-hydrolase [Lachnospiraceae bacterium]|nr:MBL fold metallo-hydrolase [Lachnospiraceae bacterium]
MRFQSFASGSSGNCIYTGSESTHILVDTGISRKRTADSLHAIDLDLKDLSGIFITHEHTDHISGLPMIMKSTDIPVFATKGTIGRLLAMSQFSGVDPARFQVVKADEKLTVGDLAVSPFSTSHDAAEPVGYRIWYGSQMVCICTDLGCYNDYTAECLRHADVLLLEANHDVNMLQVGPYPYALKQRILGERGHLSNDACGTLLAGVMNSHMRAVFLGHLSKENNYPELAYETVRLSLIAENLMGGGYGQGRSAAGTGRGITDFPLFVAGRTEPSRLISW